MVDYVKFQVLEKDKLEEFIVSENVIDLATAINLFTGVIEPYPKRGNFLNIEISITLANAYMNGSLHKFHNLCLLKGNQNYNDFNFCSIKDAIHCLTEKFKIKNRTSLTNLEFGFNIVISKDPQHVIDFNLLMYKNKHHNRDDKFRGKGDFKDFRTTDFHLKIYNKSKHYDLKENILRLELKITSKRYLQKLGVFELEDLNETEVIFRLYERLLREFDELTIIDEFYALELPKEDKDILIKFSNPHYWKDLKKNNSLKVYNRLKRDFDAIVKKYNLDKTKTEIKEKMILKFQELNNECLDELSLSKIA